MNESLKHFLLTYSLPSSHNKTFFVSFLSLFPLFLLSSSKDESAFRNLIVVLEDTKIRARKIEEREALRAIEAAEWPAHCRQVSRRTIGSLADSKACFLKASCNVPSSDSKHQYLEELECPQAALPWDTDEDARTAMLDWLLGRAVALEYSDNRTYLAVSPPSILLEGTLWSCYPCLFDFFPAMQKKSSMLSVQELQALPAMPLQPLQPCPSMVS